MVLALLVLWPVMIVLRQRRRSVVYRPLSDEDFVLAVVGIVGALAVVFLPILIHRPIAERIMQGVWSGIAPADRTVWMVESVWSVGLLAVLAVTRKWFKFSTAAYLCFWVWAVLQTVAAKSAEKWQVKQIRFRKSGKNYLYGLEKVAKKVV